MAALQNLILSLVQDSKVKKSCHGGKTKTNPLISNVILEVIQQLNV